MMSELKILKYLRLSIDDEGDGESNSIAHQRELIDSYISEKFSQNRYATEEVIDDGYSGTNFNRPGIIRALELLNAGKYNCFIVKDFSRFGRDHIQIGNYLEHIFPAMQIRVISVNDQYDSNDYAGTTGGIDVVMKNLIYELYSKDLSQKVKAARKTIMKTGKYNAPFAIYGYKKENYSLVVDEKTAPIVCRIFQLAASGASTKNIAVLLNNENILTPAEYKKTLDCSRTWEHSGKINKWNDTTVRRILKDEKYTGKMVLGKTERLKVGDPCSARKKDKSEWVVVEGTHYALVSQETFDKVAKMLHKAERPDTRCKVHKPSIYCCGKCGHTLYRTGQKNIRLSCRYATMTNNADCFTEGIYLNDLISMLKTILEVQFSIMKVNASSYKNMCLNTQQKTIEELSADMVKLKRQRFDAYEKFKSSAIGKDDFYRIKTEITNKLNKLEHDIDKIGLAEGKTEIKEHKVNLILNYPEQESIDEKFINYFIKQVKVFNGKKIEVIWNFGLEEFIGKEKQEVTL